VKAKLILRLAGMVAVGVLLTTMAHAEWKWSGYSQIRYNIWDGDYGTKKPDSDFLMRRVRVKLEGPVAEDTTVTIQADLAGLLNNESTTGPSNVELKDALITRKINPQFSVSAGFSPVPFGYEVPTSDAVQLPLERTQAAAKFFPGERDTGLYVHYRPSAVGHPQVDLGYSNGLQKWYDITSGSTNRDDASKALVVRAQWPFLKTGLAGLSYLAADRDRGPSGGPAASFSSQNLLGLHARYTFPQNCLLQAEYYDGKYLSDPSAPGAATTKDATGWYGLAAYTFPKEPITGFFRYDTLDSGDPADFSRNTVGVAYDRGKSEKFTLQFENIKDDGKGASFNNWAVQWQVKY